MKKKLIGALLVLSCVSMLAACGKTTEAGKNDKQTTEPETTVEEVVDTATPTETETTETPDEDLPSIAELTTAMQTQFTDMKNFTMKMYVSKTGNAYTEDDLYMVMGDGDGVSYAYVANFIDAYLMDDTVYYYDATQEKWFTDDYTTDDGSFSATDDVNSIKEQTFPGDTVIERRELNGVTYIAATYTDGDDNETTVTYYFDDDLKFVAASSEMLEASELGSVEAGFLYMTLTSEGVTIPEEALNAEKGDYEAYMMTAFTSMYNIDEDETIYMPNEEDTTEDVEVNESSNTDKESTSENGAINGSSEGHKKSGN